MNLEWNKIFAALLVAAIVAQFSGFFSDLVFHKEELKENAYKIEVAASETLGGITQQEAVAEPILALLATADVEKGKKLSRACAACHSFNKGGENRVGPNLWNIVQEPKSSKEGYAYSDAFKAVAGDPWTYESLNKFLWKPKKYISGTKMNYIGLKKPEQRAEIIAWLRTLSDNPVALPSQASIDAESSLAE